MSDLEVCRICLSIKVKLYKYNQYYLKEIYEQILTKKVNDKDGLPKYFCYTCVAMLYKFHKFREKCHIGQRILRDLLQKGPMTLKSIAKKRKSNNMSSSLNISSVSKRVRTYLIKSKTMFRDLGPSNYELNKTLKEVDFIPPKIEEIVMNVDSDDSLDTKNLIESRNDILQNEPLIKAHLLVEDIGDDIGDSLNNKNLIEYKNDIHQKEQLIKDEEVDGISDNSDDSSDNINLVKYKKDIVQKEQLTKDEEVEDIGDDSDDSMDNKNLKQLKKDDITYMNIKMIDQENIVNKLSITENINENRASDGESNLENRNLDDFTKGILNVRSVKRNIKTRNRRSKKKMYKENTNTKLRRFEVKSKNTLDPEHWLKITLTEEESIEDFKGRALDPKYIAAAYKCTDCYKGFSQEDMLSRHKKLRHSEFLGPIACRFCNMRFKSKCFLTRHLTQHYTKFKCLRCELMCPLQNTAIFHNDYHNGVIRKCEHCGQEFRHLSTYYTHLRTHRSEHVCTLCGASFVSATGLSQHRRTMHVNTVINPEEEVGRYCEKCDVRFETRKAYDEHIFHSLKHVEGAEDPSNLISAQPKLNPKRKRIDIRRNPRKFTTCSVCLKNFPTYTAYTKHHATEHKSVPIPKDEERHICEICGASLASGSVASHLNTHTRDRLFTCQSCGMQFSTKASMMRHQLTHTGEKPYECSLCEKRFTQQPSMKLHYRTIHLKEPYPKRNRKRKASKTQIASSVENCHDKDTEGT